MYACLLDLQPVHVRVCVCMGLNGLGPLIGLDGAVKTVFFPKVDGCGFRTQFIM